MLEVKNLCKSFPNQEKNHSLIEAVKQVCFTLETGDFCALVGESGSEKSTLSRMLLGLLPPTAGDILLDHESIFQEQNRTLRRRIQLVLQDSKSSLDPRFTVYDSIAEPMRNFFKLTTQEQARRINILMEQMELSQSLLLRKPSELSGGQQKRVCIARALAAEPEIIIFDEAVSGLDVILRKNILDQLKRLHQQNHTTYLMITHDMDVALYLANHIMVMKGGEIVEQVRYAGDLECFKQPYSKLLLAAMLPQAN